MKFKLINDDCLKVMPTLPDKSVDMICCDLPYGTTACKWDSIIPFDKLWEQYNRIIKDEGTITLFGSEPFASYLRTSNVKDYRYDYIWIKNNCSNFQLANTNPLKYHETISVFYKDIIHLEFSNIITENLKKNGLKQDDLSKIILSKNGNKTGWLSNKIKGTQIPTAEQWNKICDFFNIKNDYDDIIASLKKHTYNLELKDTYNKRSNKNEQGSLGHFKVKTDEFIQTKTGFEKSILYFDRVVKPLHPTQKPVALLEHLIKVYTNKNDTVLDNCMGSGTTGVVCKRLNRNFIGIELDTKYFEIAKERIKEDNEI